MEDNVIYFDQPIRQPKQYNWKPKEDITAYELALCMPVLLAAHSWHNWEMLIGALPESASRHFEEAG